MNKRVLIISASLSCLLIASSCGLLIGKHVQQTRRQELGGGGTTKTFAPNYDSETVLTMTGSVVRIEVFEAKPLLVKSVRIFLKAEDQIREAHLGPLWYIKKQPFRLAPGDIITITGSRVGDKVMIQQLEKKGQTFLLRNKEGQPQWFKSVIREAGPGIQNTENGN